MKKQELVEHLNNKFKIIDGKLQVKILEKPKLIKNNKIKETFISTTPQTPPTFQGHKYLEKATRDIERKANIAKEKSFASRIRGNLQIKNICINIMENHDELIVEGLELIFNGIKKN